MGIACKNSQAPENPQLPSSPGHPTRSDKVPEHQQIAALERKLQRRNEVLAELMDEHLALKASMASR